MGEEGRNLTTRYLAETAGRMTTNLPASWRQRVSVQLLPMTHVVSPRGGILGHEDVGDAGLLPHIKSMALAVYASIDRVISPSLINANRTLTGMGPAADKEVISVNFQVCLAYFFAVNRGYLVNNYHKEIHLKRERESKIILHM